MRHLWQRIFAYTLVLVIVSQLAVLLLHRYSVSREEARNFITEFMTSLAMSVEEGDAATADAVLRVFNRKRSRAWLEDAAGKVIAGSAPQAEDVALQLRSGKIVRQTTDDELVIREGNGGENRYLAAIPVSLQEGPSFLFALFGPPRGPDIWTLFFQGLVFVSVIGLLLAFWIARHVSKPLHTVRDEILEIAGGNLEGRVTVRGHDEIADVARAVNQMADSLARNILSMRELVANISHEMRSPLARMQVSLAMLEEEVEKEPKAASHLALLAEELTHMNSLIGATLLTSKLDLQAPSPPQSVVYFSDLCAEACRRHAPLFMQKNLHVIQTVQEGVLLSGEETLLTTLVSNLLDNAVKYTDHGGRVVVRLFEENGDAVLLVENSHDPLSDAQLDHIFEPFYRGGIATGNGVGLGLSLVRKIARLHGGDALAENADGAVRFITRFPLNAG